MSKKRIIDGVHKGKERMSPHPFWTLCATELSKVFSDIINDINLLSKCYCPIRTRDFDEDFIVEVTTGIPSTLLCDKSIDPDNFMAKFLKSGNFNQPFLIINDVGTGKTTYLYHYFLIGIKEYNLDQKIDGILINVANLGEGEDVPFEDIEIFFHEKINDYLISKYSEISSPNIDTGKMIFEQELIPFAGVINFKQSRGVKEYEDYLYSKIDNFISDIKLFNLARINYLTNIGKRIFIIIDNVDHFGRKTQEKIFGLSTKLLNKLNVGIIMSARDYTLPYAFRHLPLSAFNPRFLHLALPDTKGVLQKRVSYLFDSDFISEIFNYIGKDQIEVISPSGKRYIFDKIFLKKEFNIILDALISNDQIINILESLSDYDMRALLKMVKVALSSGYLLPEDREMRDSVKVKDFIIALMRGNNPYYFPEDPSTMILNIFDNDEPNYFGNNLIRLRSLQSIKYFGNKASVDDVINFMDSIGYKKDKTRNVFQLLMDKDLIESPFYEGSNIEKDNIKVVKLTFAGEFYLNYFIFNSIYLDEIKNATFLDDDIVESIQLLMDGGRNMQLSKKERISHRLYATENFIDYLVKEEHDEEIRIRSLGRAESLINYGHLDGIIQKIKSEYDYGFKKIVESLD